MRIFKGSFNIQISHHKWLLCKFCSKYQLLLNKTLIFSGNVHVSDGGPLWGLEQLRALLVCLM